MPHNNNCDGGHCRHAHGEVRSRLPQGGYCGDKVNCYFVTSEQFDYRSPRLYTVRVCNLETGDVDTIDEFQGYRSRSTADRRARWLAEHPQEPTKEHQLREARRLSDDDVRRHAWIATANGGWSYDDISFTGCCERVRQERKLPPLHVDKLAEECHGYDLNGDPVAVI